MEERVKISDIEIGVDASDWQDAVRKTGEVLVRNGRVKPEYVEDMIDTVHKLGPYIVLGPGLAMPHAKRGDRVLNSGVGIVTLKEPVFFGNKANDPVKVVVGLAGANDDIHLDIMQAIVEIFDDEKMVDVIAACKEEQQIADIFNGNGGIL